MRSPPHGSASTRSRNPPDLHGPSQRSRKENPGARGTPGHPARQPGRCHTPALKPGPRTRAASRSAPAINPDERSGLTAWPAAGRGARRAAFAESDLLSQNLTVFNVLRITKSDNQASNVYHAFTNPEADYYGIARASSRKRIEWFHADFSDRVRPANGGRKGSDNPSPAVARIRCIKSAYSPSQPYQP